MRVLYLNSGASDSNGVTTQQLAKIAPALHIAPVATVDDAVTEIRKGGWHGLLTPPAYAEPDTIALITKLRQDRVPIAIVPIVTEWRQEFFSAAVAAGADDVLLVRGETAVHAAETLTRIKQSPHLKPAEERRLRVLYVGKDTLVGSLLDQVPFIKTERGTSAADGAIAGRTPAPGPDALRADAVVIDDQPGDSPSLQVVKFVRTHAPDLPIIVLNAPTAGETAAGVLDLGVDDCIPKTGIYRRRLIASLNRIHQRHELSLQHTTIKAREARLRQIVENMPEGLAIVSADGTILAVNAAGLPYVGVAKPADIVGRDFYGLLPADRREDARAYISRVSAGERSSLALDLQALDGQRRTIEIDGAMLERDARGGRGVIAIFRPPRQASAEDAQAVKASLAAVTEEAQTRVNALSTELNKIKTAHHAERSAWDAARAQLEERLQELITDADVRQGLDIRLAAAETELRDVSAARKQLEADLEAARSAVRESTDQQHGDRARQDSLRTELETTVSALKAMTATRDELTGRLDAVRDELRQTVDRHRAERMDWSAVRRTLEGQLESATSDSGSRRELEAQLETAKRERQTSHTELTTARAELDGAREQVAAALHQFDTMRAERQRERSDLERAIAELAAERDSIRRAHDTVRAELDTVRSERDSHQTERDGLRAEHDGLRAERDGLRTERDELSSERDRLRSDRDALRSERDGLRHDLDGLRNERDGLNNERDGLGSERDRLRSERDSLRVERDASQNELRRAHDEHAADRDRWEAQRHQFESRIADAQASAVARVEVEARLEAARADMRQASDTFAAERAGWDATRRQLQTRLHEAQASASARGELEAALEAARAELRHLSETSTRDHAAWDSARRTLEHQLHEAQRAHASDRASWQADRDTYEQRLAESGHHESEVARLEDTVRTLQAQHAAYLEAQSIDRATRERERTELAALRQAVDEERARRIKLDDDLATARAEANGRVTALEVEYSATRRSLEAQINDADERAARIVGESHAAHRELKAQLAAMAASRERLAHSRLFGYAMTTLDGRLVRCNDAFAQLFGYEDGRDALARSNGGAFPPIAGREGLDARLLAERVIPQVESCLERVDGTPITVLESASIIETPTDLAETHGERELIERVLVDMSGSSALEGRLRQARRLEEVGTLASAMAPDIMSLLHAIDETGAQISADLSAKDAQQGRLDKIRTRTARANELVRQLLAFSRRQVQAPPPVDLNAAIRRAESMLTRLVGSHIEFEMRLGKADGVAAGEDDLEQLLTTLVVSGRDLLPVGGTLVLETARLDFEQAAAATGPVGPGVLLSVSASGYGVQPVQQAVAVEVVARRCGGEVRMTGEPGRRASLQVYFTRCAPAQAGRAAVKKDADRESVPAENWSWTPD